MKIVTDSGADLPADEAKDLGITVAPLLIQFPDGEVNSTDISADEFFDRLQAMGPAVPTTSQPSPGVFSNIYKELAAGGEEILSIHISSGLSGTLHAAQLGAQETPEAKVTLVDAMTLSGSLRFQVLAAHMAAKIGWGMDAILALLTRVREASEIVYTLETLDYLARGGRIGRVQALAGALLRIKPIIRVDKADGKYSSAGRGRTLNQAMDAIIEHLVKLYGTQQLLWVTVLHGQIPDIAKSFADTLRERLDVGRLEILRVSPALGVHVGPVAIGVAVLPLKVIEGLI